MQSTWQCVGRGNTASGSLFSCIWIHLTLIRSILSYFNAGCLDNSVITFFNLVINTVYGYIKSSVMWPSSVGIYTPTARRHNPEGLNLQQHAVITRHLAGQNIRLGYHLGAGTVTRQRAGRSTRRGPLPGMGKRLFSSPNCPGRIGGDGCSVTDSHVYWVSVLFLCQ